MPPLDGNLSISVNGDAQCVPPETSVGQLLGLLGLSARRIAVAINQDVVARSTFDARRLSPGDRVEILEAVGGG